MSVYAIVLNEPNTEAWTAPREHWPGRHFVSAQHLAFVAPDDPLVVTTEISDAVGLDSESGVPGIVFELHE